jgi:hypothetical protein
MLVLHAVHEPSAGIAAAAAMTVWLACPCRVKFWIIKNYMSPHHRRIIPAMAQQVTRRLALSCYWQFVHAPVAYRR